MQMSFAFKRSVTSVLLACLAAGLTVGCNKKPNGSEEPTFNTELYNLRLTEINYNPPSDGSASGNGPEFLEFKNVGATTLKLENIEITSGVTYAFPASAVLEPGEFIVLACDSAAFHKRYGFAPDGIYNGALSNSGETIVVKDVRFDSVIISVTYSDSSPWPTEADGNGYTLVLADPSKRATGPEAWRRSVRPGGSPKADDIRKEVNPELLNLRITEIHYHPLDLDGIDGDTLEFIELKNTGTKTLDLGNVAFTSGITYAFPAGSKCESNGFIVLVKDPVMFKKRYSSVKPFGIYSGSLSNNGEKIAIADIAADTEIVMVQYDTTSPWPKEADGDGYSLVPVKRNPDRNQNDPAAWRRSFNIDGSPGADDPAVVVVNEVLTHTDPPQYDAIELYNPGDDSVNIGGWYITDDRRNPMKFRIPDNTIVPPGGYVYFDETNFNADPANASSFTFNSHGEEAWVLSDARGCLYGYCHGCKFGELENGISIGRYITSDGKEVFVTQKSVTLGKENSGPLIGPLIINEIMYHSPDNEGDYVEIANISGEEIRLSHPQYPEHTWKISGISFVFPPNTSIKPGEVIVVATDTITVDYFRVRYTIPSEVQVFQMVGGLKNSGEKLKLQKPEDPYKDSTLTPADTMIFPYMVVDEVEYSDQKPWPAEADGGGKSLHRIKTLYGNDPAEWKAGNPTPGKID